jgi:hypothetical protein
LHYFAQIPVRPPVPNCPLPQPEHSSKATLRNQVVAADGEVRHSSATVTKVIDRLRRLIVKEI